MQGIFYGYLSYLIMTTNARSLLRVSNNQKPQIIFEVFDYLKPYIKALLYRDEFSGPLRLDIKLQLMLRKIDNNCGCERHYITPDEKANAMESNKLWLRMDNDYYEFLYLSNSRN